MLNAEGLRTWLREEADVAGNEMNSGYAFNANVCREATRVRAAGEDGSARKKSQA
jgi:hypothetical protein